MELAKDEVVVSVRDEEREVLVKEEVQLMLVVAIKELQAIQEVVGTQDKITKQRKNGSLK